jgi:uncharacterized protein
MPSNQPDRTMRRLAREHGILRASRFGMAPRCWQIAFVSCILTLSLFGAAAADQIVDHAAEDRHGDHAATRLGEGLAAYQRGDYATATRLLRPLADQGMGLAQLSLGVMYANGEGVPQNFGQSATWYLKAADQGDDKAQSILGAMYAKGLGVPQDLTQAVNWFEGRRSRECRRPGEPRLDGCQRPGRVPQDLVQAVHWSLKAAQQGNALAQVILGIAYQNAEGVERDFTEAAKWLRKAADQGNASAQANLCWLYANGRGVVQDDTQALMWSTLAVAGRRTTQLESSPSKFEIRQLPR